MNKCRLLSWLLLAMVSLLTACSGNGSLLPDSGGRPSEVLLVGDTLGIIEDVLESDCSGLQQPEPQFDVSTISHKHFNGAALLARNIVIVELNASAPKDGDISYRQNVDARNQIVVYIKARDTSSLKALAKYQGRQLRSLINNKETGIAAKQLSRYHDERAAALADSAFGLQLFVPVDMTSSKIARGFLWLSNNANRGMQNIVITELPKSGSLISGINAQLRRNIPGEKDGMFMQLNSSTVVIDNEATRQQLWRGSWLMTGDMMGGPFIAERISLKGRNIAIIGFTYAPQMRKRDKMRQLEAIIATAAEAKKKE